MLEIIETDYNSPFRHDHDYNLPFVQYVATRIPTYEASWKVNNRTERERLDFEKVWDSMVWSSVTSWINVTRNTPRP